MEKLLIYVFDCRRQACGLGGRTTARFTDPYMGLTAALFGRSTVDPMLGKSCKCESFKWHLYSRLHRFIIARRGTKMTVDAGRFYVTIDDVVDFLSCQQGQKRAAVAKRRTRTTTAQRGR
ncbi:hypothetical protein I656_03274 [Geobacillus sp. WSUCF1]|nr:hypothetical protein I656_03274 [Geobacillus sp. WSUCF1]